MRAVLAASLFLGLVLPAAAALAPQYYEEARQNAANVVVIAVEEVTPPAESFGWCAVSGTVEAVERGTLFYVGEAVTIGVECAGRGGDYSDVPIGGTQWQNIDTLGQSTRGRAWLDADGNVVLSQYEILE